MRHRSARIGIIFSGVFLCAHAQWLNYPTPGTPRTRDGKPDLFAPAPRANGKPDLSGIWQVAPPPDGEIERLLGSRIGSFVVPGDDPRTFPKYFFDMLADFKPDEAPIRPEAAQLFLQHREAPGDDSSEAHCLPLGIPRAGLIPVPFKIVQTPGLIVMLYEVDNTHRQVYTDGRKHPADAQPAWLGYSIGNWEAGTLTIHTVGFNDKTSLDALGHPRSESLHLTERYRRRDFGHMEVQVTVEDPKYYTRPFTIKYNALLVPDSDILESFCAENEKDRPHLSK